MRTSNVKSYLSGEEKYHLQARLALPILVRQASNGLNATIFYSSLAKELNMPNPRNLNNVLGFIGGALEKLSKDWKQKIPPIQCLVVSKRTGIPGEGIGGFLSKKEEFGKLPRREQKRLVERELIIVRNYKKWEDVLRAFGLSPALIDLSKEMSQAESLGSTQESRVSKYGSGGESAEHKKLKHFVSQNPGILGLPDSVGIGETEKHLRSGDILDVQFFHRHEFIAVEVKSKKSKEADIVRGIFQCSKYVAVLEAQQAADGKQRRGRAILVLEAKFPEKLRPLCNILGTEVLDQVSPSA
jgi:hypothetical protein